MAQSERTRLEQRKCKMANIMVSLGLRSCKRHNLAYSDIFRAQADFPVPAGFPAAITPPPPSPSFFSPIYPSSSFFFRTLPLAPSPFHLLFPLSPPHHPSLLPCPPPPPVPSLPSPAPTSSRLSSPSGSVIVLGTAFFPGGHVRSLSVTLGRPSSSIRVR